MVDVYVTITGDVDFLRSVLPTLFTEYEFWIENRTVTYVVDDYVRYGGELDVPRPESYREDLNTATNSSQSNFGIIIPIFLVYRPSVRIRARLYIQYTFI